MVFIEITNSTMGELIYKNHYLISAKEDSRLHGLGLGSASRAVKKYGGTFDYQCKMGIFTVQITFLDGIHALN